MLGLTIASIIVYVIILAREIIVKKNYFGIGTIIFVGIVFNILLFLMKFSKFINPNIDFSTYLIFIYVISTFIIMMLLSRKLDLSNYSNRIVLKDIRFKVFKYRISIYSFINYGYIALFFIENYIGSKSFVPMLQGIDIHGYSAPLISFVTRGLFVVFFLNYIAFLNFKEKKYYIYSLIEIVLFLFIRGARIQVFMAFVELAFFYFIYNYKTLKINKSRILIILALFFVLVLTGVAVGNKRLETNLKKANADQCTYSQIIRYNGPFQNSNIIPWYYGYFPMSYSNLDLTIKNIKNNNVSNTYGLFTLKPVLVGLFELDNIIPNYKDIEYVNKFRLYSTTAATVPTGFVEFFLDFGNLCIISIFLYALPCIIFYNKIKKDPFYIVLYAFYAGQWFFMSFQNMMISVVTIYVLIYLFLIKKFLVRKNTDGIQL